MVAGDFGPLTQTDRLATGSNRWTSTPGTHALIARVHVGSTIVESAVIDIVATDDNALLALPERGARPTVPATIVAPTPTTDVTTTTTSVTTATTTPAPTEPATTEPSTTEPVTTARAILPTTTTLILAPGEPPRLAGVVHAPTATNSISTDTDVSVLARVSSPSGHPITITITMKGPTGDWVAAKTCTASPCVHTSRYNAGDWQYRATVTDDLGRSATSLDTPQTRFTVDPIIK